VPGLTKVPVADAGAIDVLLQQAEKRRAVACTNMNERSSRSHQVFSLYIRGVHEGKGIAVSGCLNLCDLAGSERLSRSGAEGERKKEAAAINKSLSCLADVFSALAKKAPHVPFRNSKLTHLLQRCFRGDGKTLMLVNLSPTLESAFESLCSLRFAAQVSQVELGKPVRRVVEALPAAGGAGSSSASSTASASAGAGAGAGRPAAAHGGMALEDAGEAGRDSDDDGHGEAGTSGASADADSSFGGGGAGGGATDTSLSLEGEGEGEEDADDADEDAPAPVAGTGKAAAFPGKTGPQPTVGSKRPASAVPGAFSGSSAAPKPVVKRPATAAGVAGARPAVCSSAAAGASSGARHAAPAAARIGAVGRAASTTALGAGAAKGKLGR
jgi:hypothetical protein